MMKNPPKYVSAGQVILALTFLFSAFLHFQSALRYDGLENNFLADNWGTPLAILLTVIFGLGWHVGSSIGYVVLLKGQKIVVLALVGLISIFTLLAFGSLAFFPSGFMRYAIIASGYILMSGFFLSFSVVIPEVIAKRQEKN